MELGLKLDADMPLMAFMSRLVHQKMPDVVLATEMLEGKQVRARNHARMLPQRHVGKIQQPANVLVIGELIQVLGEMADCQA